MSMNYRVTVYSDLGEEPDVYDFTDIERAYDLYDSEERAIIATYGYVYGEFQDIELERKGI